MLRNPDPIVHWRDSVTGYVDRWSENANDMPDEDMNEDSGTLFEKDKMLVTIPNDAIQALGAFFSAREWTPEAQRTRTVKKYRNAEVITNSTNVTSYKAYRTNKDRGSQCWRTDNSRKESVNSEIRAGSL